MYSLLRFLTMKYIQKRHISGLLILALSLLSDAIYGQDVAVLPTDHGEAACVGPLCVSYYDHGLTFSAQLRRLILPKFSCFAYCIKDFQISKHFFCKIFARFPQYFRGSGLTDHTDRVIFGNIAGIYPCFQFLHVLKNSAIGAPAGDTHHFRMDSTETGILTDGNTDSDMGLAWDSKFSTALRASQLSSILTLISHIFSHKNLNKLDSILQSDYLKEVTELTQLQVPLSSVMPSVTPVCFGTFYTGVQPEIHGIKKYEKPVIKEYKPKYNILLKDDKTYPWICISNEEYPRVFTTRKKVKDGSLYYGPYPSIKLLKELQDLIAKLYPYRRCKIPMSEEGVFKNKYRACLNKQIKICSAPCEGCVSKEEYRKIINDIKKVLKGDFYQIKKDLKNQMMDFAKNLEFEKAQEIKERIQVLDIYTTKNSVVNNSSLNAEVFAYEEIKEGIILNAMKIVNGCLISSISKSVNAPLEEDKIEIFTSAIMQLRTQMEWESDLIIVAQALPLPEDYARQDFGTTTEKKQVLELCQRNALFAKNDKIKRDTLLNPERWSENLVLQIQKDLNLPKPPYYMECFDNSNIQGASPISAMVTYIDGIKSPKDYRKYNIKTVVGADDYHTMQEVLTRRYTRVLKDNLRKPNLVIVDG